MCAQAGGIGGGRQGAVEKLPEVEPEELRAVEAAVPWPLECCHVHLSAATPPHSRRFAASLGRTSAFDRSQTLLFFGAPVLGSEA